MHQIQLPDHVFFEAERVASEWGVSVDKFVVDAVQLHLTDTPGDDQGPVLSEDDIRIIRRAQADIKAGRGLTMEQVEVRLAARKAEWLRENQS